MVNKDQLYYWSQLVTNSNGDLILLVTGSLFAAGAAIDFYNCSFLNGAAEYLASGFISYLGINDLSLRQKLNKELSEPNTKKKYPLEYSEKVIIADEEGLEKLLERTALEEELEWGTFLKSHSLGTTAVVDEIMDSHEAEKEEYISNRKKITLKHNYDKGYQNGYNGLHHFHPTDIAANFSVSNNDRLVMGLNSLQLLTFNFRGKPEVIGFNKRFTYIPEERDCKSRLVRASSKDIMRYLER